MGAANAQLISTSPYGRKGPIRSKAKHRALSRRLHKTSPLSEKVLL